MTEEVKPDVKQPEQAPAPEGKAPDAPEQPQYTPLEQEMLTQGWKPKDQWEGDPDEFVSAPEYKRRGELFKKIADTNRRLEKASNAINALTQHQKQLYQAGYTQALKELRAEHAVAVENGDVKMADKIVDKIEETKAAQQAAAQLPVQQAEPPVALDEFKSRNAAWYGKDEVMTAYADRVGHEFARNEIARGYRPSFEQVVEAVEKKVREKFPSSFGGKRTVSSVVDGGSASSVHQPAARRDTYTLSAEETKVMRNFVEAGVMTKEEYIADLKKIKGVK